MIAALALGAARIFSTSSAATPVTSNRVGRMHSCVAAAGQAEKKKSPSTSPFAAASHGKARIVTALLDAVVPCKALRKAIGSILTAATFLSLSTIAAQSVISLTASILNSRLNFRFATSTLQFVGRDLILTGGAGADVFVFRTVAEAGSGAGHDVILDFKTSLDRIDLSGIDANAIIAGNQGFAFIGSAQFSAVAGQLRFGNGLVTGDVDGDGSADFAIEIGPQSGLTQSDFLL